MYIVLHFSILVTLINAIPTRDPFYVIAHMANSEAALQWAVEQGANALEGDLHFDDNGNPTVFEHGGVICDCLCNIKSDHICTPLLDKCEGESASRDAATHFQHIARLNGIALYVIDSKVTPTMGSILAKAGSAVVKFVDENLFSYGFQGKVIIGSAKFQTYDYVRAAAIASKDSVYKDRYYFTFDEEGNNYFGVMDMLSRFTTNRVFGTGASSCTFTTFYSGINDSVKGVKNGANGLAYIWTVDRESLMKNYINAGVQGILTNRVAAARGLVISMGLRLATPSDNIPVSLNSVPIQNVCECDHYSGGCVIARPPPKGKACECRHSSLITCTGSLVNCSNPSSSFCADPDLTPGTCILGGGDCNGYPDNQSCDCDYFNKNGLLTGGCKITRAMISGLACKCTKTPIFTCFASPVACDLSNPKCKNPDTSKESCELGGGNCEGY